MQLKNNLEFNKNQALNMLLQMISGNHGSPTEGIIWYDSGGKVIKYYDGTNPVTLASGSGISPNVLDANSVLYAVTDNTPAALALGASTIVGRKSTGNVVAMTMAELVTELLAVDGAASLLDADKLDGQEGTYYLSRANHTGTQTASTISDFDTQVRTSRLDQMAAPTADVSLNTRKITGLGTPTADTDAATKGYVDGVAQGLSAKASVRVATTANGTLASSFANGQSVDGVTLATGDRILIKNQSTGSENGIYTVNASGAPTRATDFDTAGEIQAGAYFFVEEGTANANSGWVLTTDGTIVVNTTALTFEQFSGAGQVTAGNALTKTGNTLDVAVDGTTIEVNADALRIAATAAGSGLTGGGGSALAVNVDSTTIEINSDTVRIAATAAGDGLTGGGGSALAVGAGTGISVTANAVAIDTAVVARKYSATIGDGAASTITVTHNLGTEDVVVQFRLAGGTKEAILVDWKPNGTNPTTQIDATFAVAPTSNEIRVTVIG